jgi:ribosome-associated protein
MPDQENPAIDDEPAKPTRTDRRKLAEAFSSLAESLAKGPDVLPAPPFDDVLTRAVMDARTLTKSARARQIRRLAKLLQAAAPLEDFRAALAGRTEEAVAKREQERINERWRTRLLEEGDAALAEFIELHPSADRSHLRKLARQARRTPADARSKKAATSLFREIRALFELADTRE